MRTCNRCALPILLLVIVFIATAHCMAEVKPGQLQDDIDRMMARSGAQLQNIL